MRSTIVSSVLAFLLSYLLAVLFLSPDAQAKGPKSAAPKIHMCESTDLYFGPVETGTKTVRLSEVCKDVTIKIARKSIAECSDESPVSCEVLYSADKTTLYIEHKISSTKEVSK